jgi:hypothetical protein
VVDEAKDGGPRANDDGTNRRKQHGNIPEPRDVRKVKVRGSSNCGGGGGDGFRTFKESNAGCT